MRRTGCRLVTVSYAGLAMLTLGRAQEYPWPQIYHDARRTGRSAAIGPQTSGALYAWATGGASIRPPVVSRCGQLLAGVRGRAGEQSAGGCSEDGLGPGPGRHDTLRSNGTIYAPASGVYAFHPDGSQKWRYFPTGYQVPAALAPAIGAGGTLFVSSGSSIYAVR
jgi:hypothetical protein